MIADAPGANAFYPRQLCRGSGASKMASLETAGRSATDVALYTIGRGGARGTYEIREKIMDSFSERQKPTPPQMHSLFDGCVKIVSAYVSHNAIPVVSLPRLIKDVHDALHALDAPAPAVERANLVPAVDLKKSVTSDYIVCLEDGKRFKTLKRHLRVHYGLTPEEYRQKWGLAPNYPMVAQNYANRRSELAKLSGLGANGSRREIAR